MRSEGAAGRPEPEILWCQLIQIFRLLWKNSLDLATHPVCERAARPGARAGVKCYTDDVRKSVSPTGRAGEWVRWGPGMGEEGTGNLCRQEGCKALGDTLTPGQSQEASRTEAGAGKRPGVFKAAGLTTSHHSVGPLLGRGSLSKATPGL